MKTLQVEPEIGAGRNLELPRKFRGAHAQFFQFCGQMFARVNSGKGHDVSPN
jgi:hypothetical protein